MIVRPSLRCSAVLVFVVGASATRVAAQCATQWLPGQGLAGTNGEVFATTLWDPDGAGPQQPVVVVGGSFRIAGTVVANSIAIHDPVSGAWSALGSGMGSVSSFWPGGVSALTVLPNGDLVAGGQFITAGGVSVSNVARWDGTNWSPLGGLNGTVRALTLLPNGDLVAGGTFTWSGSIVNYIARWNGSTWLALGAGMNNAVRALTTMPNGDLVAGGAFTSAGGVSANYIARWNGTSWSALGSGTNNMVQALTTLPNGDLVVGGNFTVVSGAASQYLARLTTTCPATAVSYGAGCTGSGGPNVLATTSLPWIGSTFRSVATGMPAVALALGVFGFSTTSVPMPAILPQGVPGCTLLVSPDLLELYVPAAGIVQTQLVIPNTVALAGVILHEQVVPIELSGTGSITALTGTNALTLTIGAF